ncbi:MAG: tRNA uridine-5-carboxymethylaminomethyl(34) synthesis GTPase MnmE [Burkholderiales bacterium]
MGTGPRPKTEVIGAIATPPGRGGIGIVRVSGPHLADWGSALIGRDFVPRRPMRARFLDRDGVVLDDGLALFFPAPHSYTGEDIIELHGHGGNVVTRMLLGRALELGARLAEPGEFTRRAFLNDKLDLAQAEAVADLIDAATEGAARSAMRSLQGEFSQRIEVLVAQLVELRMLVEATLDFPEEEIDPIDRGNVRERLATLNASLQETLALGRQGSLLRSGMHVVLVGQPNVGKSSLVNRLAGEEVAIVTPIPGTTRDAIRQTVSLDGVPVHLIDTAGLRESTDVVERLGIARTWTEIEKADVAVMIVDARVGVVDADRETLEKLPARLKHVIVHNKADLSNIECARSDDALGISITLSALTGAGVPILREVLLEIAGWHPGGEDVFMARERHVKALTRASVRITAAEGVLPQTELLAEELRSAHEALNGITGAFTADDLLGEIFSRFCIGK